MSDYTITTEHLFTPTSYPMSESGSSSDSDSESDPLTVDLQALQQMRFPTLPDFVAFQKKFNSLLDDGEEENTVGWDKISDNYNKANDSFLALKDFIGKFLSFFGVKQNIDRLGLEALKELNVKLNYARIDVADLVFGIPENIRLESLNNQNVVTQTLKTTMFTIAIDEKFTGGEYNSLVIGYNSFKNILLKIQWMLTNLSGTVIDHLKNALKNKTSEQLDDQFEKAKAVSKEFMRNESSAEFPLYRAAESLLSTINYFDQIFLPGQTYTLLDIKKATDFLPKGENRDDLIFVKFNHAGSQRIVAARMITSNNENSFEKGTEQTLNLGKPITAGQDWNENTLIRYGEFLFRNSPSFWKNEGDGQQSGQTSGGNPVLIPQFSKYLVTLGREMKAFLLEAKKNVEEAEKEIDTKGLDGAREEIKKLKDFASKFLADGTPLSSSRAEGSLLPESHPEYRGGIHIPAYGRAMQLKELMG